MNVQKLGEALKKYNQPKFRLEQIKKAIYQDSVSSFVEISTLSKELREALSGKMSIISFSAEKILRSRDGRSVKALIKLNDGNCIETVLLSPKPDTWSACISCQVGCPMGCDFCATGKLGLVRNLTAEEITDQVLFWRQYLKTINQKLSTIVYMGMGEPFANWEEVKKSLEILTDKNLFCFGSRSISVSTSGITEGIEKLAEDFPQVNLAVSLHFADSEKRSRFMPVNRSFDLEKLKTALQKYLQKTNRKIFIEYVMLAGINDGQADAEKLVKYLRSIGNARLAHINLIRYNPTPGSLAPSSKLKTQNFKNYLVRNKVPVTIRKSLGGEIQGACGQLAPPKRDETRE